MKKFLALALAVLMLLSLVACGEKTPATNDENTTPSSQQTEDPGQQEQTQPDSKQNEEADDLTTVEGFMKAFGITEDDMKCAKFTRIDKTSYDIDSGKIIEIGSYISEVMTDEEVRTWIENIITKLDSLSDDGKIMTYGDGELTVDYIMEKSMKVASGSYQYKGKNVAMSITVFKGQLDNADPNEAMPACTLSLEFKK